MAWWKWQYGENESQSHSLFDEAMDRAFFAAGQRCVKTKGSSTTLKAAVTQCHAEIWISKVFTVDGRKGPTPMATAFCSLTLRIDHADIYSKTLKIPKKTVTAFNDCINKEIEENADFPYSNPLD